MPHSAKGETSGTLAGADEIRPEFIRLPKVGTYCRYTGLSRSALNELILGDNPKVRSMVLRKNGSSRGTRHIVYRSLIDYLYSLEDKKS